MVAPRTPEEHALAEAVAGVERLAAQVGWDQATRVFSLVRTREAAASDASFRAQLIQLDPEQLPAAHLTPVEQAELPDVDSVEELLARLAWPESVHGAALVVERVLLRGDDADATTRDALASPRREDVRLAVGVTREGASWCVMRARSQDDEALRPQGADLVPGLVEQLAATFRPVA